MVLETLAQQILSLVNWGITIVVIMLVWEVYKFIAGSEGGKGVADVTGKAGKKIWKYMPGTAARAKRVTKKEMNEYIMEEREEEKLNEIKQDVSAIISDVTILRKKVPSSSPEEEKSESEKFLKAFDKLGDKITDAKKYFRSLNRRTFRAQKGIGRLFGYMKDKGVKDDELVKKVTVIEGTILKLHEQTAKVVGKVEAEYGGIDNLPAMRKFRRFQSNSISSGELDILRHGFAGMGSMIEEALQHQVKAKQELQGIIALTRNIFK